MADKLRIVLMLSLLAAAPLAAQQGAFVARLGTDTLSVERFTRTADRLEGEVLVRSPRVVRRRYTMQIGPDGQVTAVELRTSVLTAEGEDSLRTRRFEVPRGAVPLVADAWAPWEMLTMRARRERADSLRLTSWELGAPQNGWIEALRVGGDSLVLRDQNQAQRSRVDHDGRLLSLVRPAQQFRVERVPMPYLNQLATAWADRERRAGRMGDLSPRDTTRASIAGATLIVDYSRPSRRGRVVFGRVVPWNEVWRTGANAATKLTTDRELELGGVRIPAGSYSLWTLPSEERWALIINADSAPGGNRDPARDLFRFDMRVAAPARSVEQFTIAILPEGPGGVLRLQWENVEASMPFTVR